MGNSNKVRDLEMRIFLCGSYSYNLLNNLLGKDYKIKTIDSNYKFCLKEDLNWEYFLIDSNIKNKELSNYLFENVKKIVLDKNKINKEKNVIVQVTDSKENAKEILSKFMNENALYHPEFIFMLKKENIIEIQKELEESITSTKLDKLKITVVNYNEENFFPLVENLLRICSYYNELGDEFSFPPVMNSEDVKLNSVKYEATFNGMVIGKPGSGKSTFINKILGKKRCKTGIGFSVTSKISKYYHDKYPILLFDVPGFEKAEHLTNVIKKIKELEKYMKTASEKIDVIFYLVNKSTARTFFEEELNNLLAYLKDLDIPIFFVITKCGCKEQGIDFVETTKINLIQKFGEKTKLIDYVFPIEMVEDKFGIDVLFKAVSKLFSTYLLDESEFSSIKKEDKDYEKKILAVLTRSKFFNHYKSYEDLLNKCYWIGVGATGGSSVAAMAIGFFSIPFSDAPLLIGLEISLIIGIAACYGIQIDKAKAKEYLGSITAGTTIASAGIVAGKLKLLPGLGTLLGSALEGALAGTSIATIGFVANKIFYDQAKKKDFKDVVLNHMEFYRKAVEFLNNITNL